MTSIDTGRALGWRMRRQALDRPPDVDAVQVARRVVALRAWPADLAELSVGVRQRRPEPDGVTSALERGELVRSYAFRGGAYVLTPEVAAVLLTVRTTSRVWETRRYQAQGGFAIDDWEPLRETVRDLLSTGPKTRGEIAARLGEVATLRHLAAAAATGAGSDSLYKPLHWWGDICFGPDRDEHSTFRLLRDDPAWPGAPDVDDAGRRAVALYLGAYGPATAANLAYWLVEGLSVPRRRLAGWVADLGDDVARVSLDGAEAHALAADVSDLEASEASDAVRLLPAFDPWVNGPGTADPRIVAPERRSLASRGAHLVVRGGLVSGTWRRRGPELVVSWFAEAGHAPERALTDEVARLAPGDLRLLLEAA